MTSPQSPASPTTSNSKSSPHQLPNDPNLQAAADAASKDRALEVLPLRIPEGVFDIPKEQAGLTGGTNPISELFALYPRVSVAEAKKVIAHLRSYRKEMGADGKKKAAPAKPAREASARAKAAQAKQLKTADLLSELGLDI